MSRRALSGLLLLAVLMAAFAGLASGTEGARTLVARLGDHLFGSLVECRVRFEAPCPLYAGDPVFSIEGQSFARLGTVIARSTDGHELLIQLDPVALRRHEGVGGAVAMTPEGNLAWMARTLVPPELRARITADLSGVWQAERDATLASLEGPARALIGDLLKVLAADLPQAFEAERVAWAELQAVFGREIFDAELEAALQHGVGRRLELAMVPAVASLGQEIWGSIETRDIARVVWGATRGWVGIGQEDEVAKRLSALLEEKALPIIRARATDLFQVAMGAVREGLADPQTQTALRSAAERLLSHPQFATFMTRLSDRWVLQNERLRQRLLDALESTEFRAPIERLLGVAEPALQGAIQDMLSRADRQGMNHQLVRVLRRMVLWKDTRYLLLEPSPSPRAIGTGAILTGRIGFDP